MEDENENMTLEKRFEQFCKTQQAENREIRQRLKGVESALGDLCEGMSSGEYIEMRKEALSYIRDNRVDVEDRILLFDRYKRYKSLSGKNNLDSIMEEVSKLPPKIHEGDLM